MPEDNLNPPATVPEQPEAKPPIKKGVPLVIALDPNPFKLDMARRLGATYATTDIEQAREEIIQLTRGQLADLCVVTVGVLEPEITADAVSLIGKAGRVVLTSVSRSEKVLATVY